MNIINEEDLSDISTRKLIAEYQGINQKIALLEIEIEERKKDLTYNDDYKRELRSLERNSSNIKADIINGHKQMMGKAVGYCIKKYGVWDDKKGKMVPLHDLNGFGQSIDEYGRLVEVDDDELKSEALCQFQRTLHKFDLSKENSDFSQNAFRDICTHIKRLFGIAGMKTKKRKAIWAEQCLQKLVNVRRNECLSQGREVKFSEVAKILGIKQKVVDGLLSICSHTESLYLEDIKGGGVKSDYYDNGLEEDCRAEVDNNAKDDWLQQNAEKICSRKELDVLAHRLMEPKLYLVSITSTTEEFPVVDNRIKEIENLISQNKYDERLVDMLKDFFGFEPRSTQEPDVDLLIRLGIYKN
jgi:hypothetical protein